MLRRLLILIILVQPLWGVWLTYEEAVQKSPFKTASIGRVRAVPGEDAFLFRGQGENNRSWYKVSLPHMDTTRLLDGKVLHFQGKDLEVTGLSLSESGDKVLIQTNREKIWRYSHWGTYYVYDLKKKRLSALGRDPRRLRNAKL